MLRPGVDFDIVQNEVVAEEIRNRIDDDVYHEAVYFLHSWDALHVKADMSDVLCGTRSSTAEPFFLCLSREAGRKNVKLEPKLLFALPAQRAPSSLVAHKMVQHPDGIEAVATHELSALFMGGPTIDLAAAALERWRAVVDGLFGRVMKFK